MSSRTHIFALSCPRSEGPLQSDCDDLLPIALFLQQGCSYIKSSYNNCPYIKRPYVECPIFTLQDLSLEQVLHAAVNPQVFSFVLLFLNTVGSRPAASAQRALQGGATDRAGTGAGQGLLEDIGPRVSLDSLGPGRPAFQAYLDTRTAQAAMLAARTLDKQARQALR